MRGYCGLMGWPDRAGRRDGGGRRDRAGRRGVAYREIFDRRQEHQGWIRPGSSAHQRIGWSQGRGQGAPAEDSFLRRRVHVGTGRTIGRTPDQPGRRSIRARTLQLRYHQGDRAGHRKVPDSDDRGERGRPGAVHPWLQVPVRGAEHVRLLPAPGDHAVGRERAGGRAGSEVTEGRDHHRER